MIRYIPLGRKLVSKKISLWLWTFSTFITFPAIDDRLILPVYGVCHCILHSPVGNVLIVYSLTLSSSAIDTMLVLVNEILSINELLKISPNENKIEYNNMQPHTVKYLN